MKSLKTICCLMLCVIISSCEKEPKRTIIRANPNYKIEKPITYEKDLIIKTLWYDKLLEIDIPQDYALYSIMPTDSDLQFTIVFIKKELLEK